DYIPPVALEAFHLEEVELDRCFTAEDGDGDLDLALLRIDLFYSSHEVRERPIDDADALAFLEAHLHARLLRFHLADAGAHLGLFKRRGRCSRADEARDTRRVPDYRPGLAGLRLLWFGGFRVVLLEGHHLHQHVAGEDLAGHRAPLAVPDLDLINR